MKPKISISLQPIGVNGGIENVPWRDFAFGGRFAFGCRTLACEGSVIFEKNLRGAG